MSPEMLIVSLIGVPLVGALLISQAGRWPNVREAITLITNDRTWEQAVVEAPDLIFHVPSATFFLFLPRLRSAFAAAFSCIWLSMLARLGTGIGFSFSRRRLASAAAASALRLASSLAS